MRELETKRLLLKNCEKMTQRVFSEIGRVTVRLQNTLHGMCIRI